MQILVANKWGFEKLESQSYLSEEELRLLKAEGSVVLEYDGDEVIVWACKAGQAALKRLAGVPLGEWVEG